MKLLYRINAEEFVWAEKSTYLGDPIRRGKARVLDILFGYGYHVDQVAGSTSKGGTATTGNEGRRFFSEKAVPIISECIKDKYKDSVLNLHKNLSVALRILSSRSQVNLEKYHELITETSLMIAENFSWADINYTLHGVLHHSEELIILNNGWSIGELSEEGLEANNKFIRKYLEERSRKTSPVDQLTDVMSRLLAKE